MVGEMYKRTLKDSNGGSVWMDASVGKLDNYIEIFC